MKLHTWFSTLNVQKVELKLASVLAIATACIVLLIVSWSFFASTTSNNTSQMQSSTHQEVQTIERPTLSQVDISSQQDTTRLKQTQTTAKTLTKKVQAHKKSVNKIILGQGNYFVQVGAFTQAKLARLMLEKMKKKYHYAIIQQKGDKHAVWVGPVVTKADAINLQQHLQRKNNIQGFIVTKK